MFSDSVQEGTTRYKEAKLSSGENLTVMTKKIPIHNQYITDR